MRGDTLSAVPLRKSQVRLTERDLKLMRDLYDLTVMSFKQVQELHFGGLSKVTASNRLSQLQACHFVSSHRVGIISHARTMNRVDVVFRITKEGIKILRSHFPNEIFRNYPLPLNTQSLMHDLLLNDVLLTIKRANPKLVVTHGSLLPFTNTNRRRPDAIVTDSRNQMQTALELELSTKSERRYREIVLGYRLWSELTHVLYVTANAQVTQKVQTAILGFDVTKTQVRMPTGKFYFVNMHDLLSKSAEALPYNGETRLNFMTDSKLQNVMEGSR